jgi:hypothetical protein
MSIEKFDGTESSTPHRAERAVTAPLDPGQVAQGIDDLEFRRQWEEYHGIVSGEVVDTTEA